MNTPPPDDEVRQCARCGKPRLICTHRWQHRVMGIDAPTWTRDFECQSCGAKVTLHPQKHIQAERLFAYVMMPAIFPGVYFLLSARRKARAWTDNPVVGGVSYQSESRGPRDRLCACGGAARCIAIRRSQTRRVSIGMRYDYQCRRCASVFAVHDVAGVVFSFAAASILSAAGALVIVFPPGSEVGAEQGNRWFGLLLLVLAAIAWVSGAMRLNARGAHPEVDREAR